MNNDASLVIKIAVESGPVKTNLDRVKEEFRSASAGISSALKSIQGFAEIKRQTEEMTRAYGEAQRKVADLAKEAKAGGGGAAMAKDLDQAKAAAARLKDALSGQQQELQRVRTALSAAGVSTVGLSGHQQRLRTELEQTKGKYQELATIANARDTLGLRPHTDIQAAIKRTRDAYSELARSGKLSLAELAQAKVAMRAKIDDLTKSTNGWRDALGEIKGRALEVGATLGVLVLASKTAISFESAMANVQKTVGGTKEELKNLGGELRDMSHTIPLAADQLANIAASGGQLGIVAADIGKFTQVTAKMAVAFDMTADAAGDSIGKIKNVYQLTIPEVEGLGDSINQLGNTTAAKEKDIVDVMLRVGGTSKQFGLAKEQTAALAAAFLSLGKAPEIAGTSINSMLNTMQTATMGSKDFKEALGKIGMSAEQMAAEVAKNPQKALDDLLNTLSKLQGQERAEVLTGLFGKEFQDDIGVLVGSLNTYKEAMGQVADKTKYAGSMNKEFETRSATTENQLQLLKNVVIDIARGVGDGFLPAINAAAKMLKELLLPVASLIREFPRLSALIASAGAGFIVFNTATKIVDILRMAVTKIGPAAGTSLGQAGGAVTKLTGLLGPALKLVAAFSAGWTFGTWLNQFEWVQRGMTSLIYTMDRLQLGARRMWAALTGGDVAAIDEKIRIAKEAYGERLKEIEKEGKEASQPPEKKASEGGEKKPEKTPAEEEQTPLPQKKDDESVDGFSKQELEAMDTWKREDLSPERQAALDKYRLEKNKGIDANDPKAGKKRNSALSKDQEKLVDALSADQLTEGQLAERKEHYGDTLSSSERKAQQKEDEKNKREEAKQEKVDERNEEALARASRRENRQKERKKEAAFDELRETGEKSKTVQNADGSVTEYSIEGGESATQKQEREYKELFAEREKLDKASRKTSSGAISAHGGALSKEEWQSLSKEQQDYLTRQASKPRYSYDYFSNKTGDRFKGDVDPSAGLANAAKMMLEQNKIQAEQQAELENLLEESADLLASKSAGRNDPEALAKKAEDDAARKEELRRQDNESAEERKKQAVEEVEAAKKANADRIAAAKQGAEEWAKAEVAAADKAKSALQKYADKVKSLYDDIAGRERSLRSELDNLDTRSTAESKWRRQAKEAKEYEKAAKAAAAAGDLNRALALSDQAKDAYRSLKDGAGTISTQMAQRTAVSGIKSSGELGIEIARMLMGDVGKQIRVDLGPAGSRLAAAAGQVSQAGSGRPTGTGGQSSPSRVVEIRFKGGSVYGNESSTEALLRDLELAGLAT